MDLRGRRIERRHLLLGLGVLGLGGAGLATTSHSFRAARLLFALRGQTLANGRPPPPRAETDLHGTRYRTYGPEARDAIATVIVAHGVHHHGMDDPRLIQLAQEWASLGYRIVTPHLEALTRYRIDTTSVTELERRVLAEATPDSPVGLLGFSFGGSMALLCAREPTVAQRLKYVASIGGYHDLERTLRSLVTHVVEGPSGSVPRRAHEYGALLVLLDQLPELDLGVDQTTLERALLHLLRESRTTAYQQRDLLRTARGRQLFAAIEEHQIKRYAPQILGILERKRGRLARISPKGQLAQLKTRVILLHGSSDDIIPPEETLFAALELAQSGAPPSLTLISPLLSHSHLDKHPDVLETWRLIHALAQLM